MKLFQLVGLIVCAAFFVSCESTQTAGQGNQERKRLAALQQQQPQLDESDLNLWNAQHDRLVTGTNPALRY